MATPDSAPVLPTLPVEIRGYDDLDLRVLSPPEIVDVHRVLRRHDRAAVEASKSGVYSLEEHGPGVALAWGVSQAIDGLPERDLDFARDVYAAFATSPLAEDRRHGAWRINRLTRVDHDYGLELWDQLLRDVDPDVRRAAVWSVRAYRERVQKGNRRQMAESAEETGLTSREAARLLRTYEAAERGERICDLGELALLKLTDGHPLRHVTLIGQIPSLG
jgi:hypothetical protein